jgi:hypothetical protein
MKATKVHATVQAKIIKPIPEGWIDRQFAQYPDGPLGISYFRGDMSGDIEEDLWVDCLLYRDDSGKVRRIFNYFPVETPPEMKGNFLVMVHPDPELAAKGAEYFVRKLVKKLFIEEHMWVFIDGFIDKVLTGTLENEPILMMCLKMGDGVEVRLNKIEDVRETGDRASTYQ